MKTKHYSLTEAEEYTGKSRSSLRRFVESITKPEQHADRQYILPTVDEVAELHANSHPFSWKISETLLDREFRQQRSQTSKSSSEDSQSAVIELLKETLKTFRSEIEEKNKQIAQFQDRQRETNILLKQTTEKLAVLTEAQPNTASYNVLNVQTSSVEEGESPIANSISAARRETLWDKLRKPLFVRK